MMSIGLEELIRQAHASGPADRIATRSLIPVLTELASLYLDVVRPKLAP